MFLIENSIQYNQAFSKTLISDYTSNTIFNNQNYF
jgi:hypothetical protein